MKKWKRIAVLLLSATMVITAPAYTMTATESGENIGESGESTGESGQNETSDFVIDENGVLTGYNGAEDVVDVVIPDGVTAIADSAFCYQYGIGSITIPDGVTSIGKEAFNNCYNLATITIPSTVTSIGEGAFNGTLWLTAQKETNNNFVVVNNVLVDAQGAAAGITIPDPVTVIGASAFKGNTNITEIVIPSSVTRIEDNAFSGCSNLTAIAIPDSVTHLGTSAFQECTSLAEVTIPSTLTDFGGGIFDNTPWLEAQRAANDNWLIVNGVLLDAKTVQGNVTIPNTVTYIADEAFGGNYDVTGIRIPNTVSSIGNEVFHCQHLEELIIPSSVTSIGSEGNLFYTDFLTIYVTEGSYAASYNYENKGVHHGLTVTVMDENGFVIETTTETDRETYEETEWITLTTYKGDAVHVTVPSNVEQVGSAFNANTALQSVVLPENVTYISGSAFDGCTSLTDVTMTNKVTKIGDGAFGECSALTGIELSDEITRIGRNLFKNCTSLENIVIPEKVTEIGSYAFSGCSALTSVTIPNSVTTISDYAFNGCSALTSIEIPHYVTSIGSGAFDGCSNLTIHGKTGSCAEEYATSNNIPFVSTGEITYKLTLSFNDGEDTDGDGAKDTEDTIFEVRDVVREEAIGALPMPEREGYIFTGWYSEPECWYEISSDLTLWEDTTIYAQWQSESEVEYVFDIQDGVLVSCYANGGNLVNVVIPEGVTKIGDSVFYGCSSLKYVTIPEGVTSIDNQAFMSCNNLVSVTLPESVTFIGENAFHWSVEIHGKAGSYAETYAKNNGLTFKALEDSGEEPSDPETTIWTITFDANGGTDLSENIREVADGEELGTLPTVTREGYLLVGWYTEDDEEIDAEYVVTENVTVYAKWEAEESTEHDIVKVEAVEPTCTEDGYEEHYMCNTCGQLFADEEGRNAIVLDDVAEEKLGHLWSDEFSADEENHWYACERENCEETDALSEHTDNDENGVCDDCGYSVCVNHDIVKVEAVEPSCEVGGYREHYKCNICGQLFEDEAGTIGTTLEDLQEYLLGHIWVDEWVTDENNHWHACQRGGCEAIGLTEEHADEDGDEACDSCGYDMSVNNDDPETTVWTVTFKANGGTNLSVATKEVAEDAAIGTLPTVEREGYTLKGWFTAAEGGNKVTETYTVTEDMTVYAQWEAVEVENPDDSEPDAPSDSEEDDNEADAPSDSEEDDNESDVPSDSEEDDNGSDVPSDSEEDDSESDVPSDSEEDDNEADAPSDSEEDDSESDAPSDSEEDDNEADAPSDSEEDDSESDAPSDSEEDDNESDVPSDSEEDDNESDVPSDSEEDDNEADVPSDSEEDDNESDVPSDSEEEEDEADKPSDFETEEDEADKPSDSEQESEKPEPDVPSDSEQEVVVELDNEIVTEKTAEITKAEEGTKIVISMKKEDNTVATVIPKEILEAAQNKDVDIVLDMGDYSWTINGKDITAEELASINLEIKMDTNAIPNETVSEVAEEGAVCRQVSLTHNGNFGFKAVLNINLGSEFDNMYGALYYYNNGALEYMGQSLITDGGQAAFDFTHASDYVVVIRREPVTETDTDTETDTNTGTNTDSPAQDGKGDDGSAETGDNSSFAIWFAMMLLGAGLLVINSKKFKKVK